MARGRTRIARFKPVLCLGAALGLLCLPGPALAQTTQAAAGGSATLLQPAAGAGVAFDVASQVLTAVFLSGQSGEQLSLLLPRRRARDGADLAALQAYAGPGNVLVLSADTVSIGLDRLDAASHRSGRTTGTDTLLVLAQFN